MGYFTFYRVQKYHHARKIHLTCLVLFYQMCCSWVNANTFNVNVGFWKSITYPNHSIARNPNFPWLAYISKSKGRSTKPPTALKHMEGFIVGGRETEIDKIPWIAQLIVDGEPHCGGVVVSSRVVITAAHCILDDDDVAIDVKRFTVLVGSSYELQGIKHAPCRIVKHPKYHENEDIPFYYYDLAIMLLKHQIKFGKDTKPATIIYNKNWKNKRYTFVVAGFGVINNNDDGVDKVRRTRMRYVDSKTCNKAPSILGDGGMPVPPHMFCLLGDKNTSDCRGDSGSGVMWSDYVVGLVSTGRVEGCGSKTVPNMFIDLSFFRVWIREWITKLELMTVGSCKKHNTTFTVKKKLSSKTEKAFQWLAQILVNDKPRCDGLVLTKRVVLTAARCVLNDELVVTDEKIQVEVLSNNYKICKVYGHQKYKHIEEPDANDVALILLKKEINGPVMLPEIITNNYWKLTDADMLVVGHSANSHIGYTKVYYVDRRTCDNLEKLQNVKVTREMFCLAHSEYQDNECYGDSGAAVYWKGFIVGLMSIDRKRFCDSVRPFHFIDLTYHKQWIKESILKLQLTSIHKCEQLFKRRKNNKKAMKMLQPQHTNKYGLFAYVHPFRKFSEYFENR